MITRVFLLVCCVCLSACVPSKPMTSPTSSLGSAERKVWLNSLKAWEVSGRFAVTKQDEGTSGSFEWSQLSKENYQIHFYGPFGAGNTHLTAYFHHIIWEDNSGQTVALTPEELFYNKTGFFFPVSFLQDWILGRPAPIVTFGKVYDPQWDQQSRLVSFVQAGWRINYLAYTPVEQGELPSKMELTHNDIKLKLIMNSWVLKK